ncbi:ABC transporter permease [Agrilactobacillus yilanensis]|uniref:ABC transporter permease n=1 Tax=Agrilactobacillus yilanensis TaxID=2485997 RepID=A0ABW4JBW3_9LACO|nr:ABC transporter permease subunit [Agrilactobacillus yilanensis]
MSRKVIQRSIIIIIFALLILMPLAVIVFLSVGQQWHYPRLFPGSLDWGYYFRQLTTNVELLSSLRASLLLAGGTIILTLVIAYPTAIALAYYTFPGKRLFSVCVYLPLIVPGIALLTNIDFMMIKYSLTGTFFGVICVHTLFCLPYAVKLLVDNLVLLKNRYEVTGRNLGASPWQTFFKITLPLSKPGLQGALMMTYIVSMTQYLATLMVGNGNYLTLSVRMFPFTQEGKYQIAAVYGVTFMLVTLVPLFILDSLLNRQRKRG